MINIHNIFDLGHLPDGHNDYDYETLTSDIVKTLENIDATAVFYWYGVGSYCGTGELILLTDNGRWYLYSLGHCSCYGPLENITSDVETGYNTFTELEEACTKEYKNLIHPLIQLIKDKGYVPTKSIDYIDRFDTGISNLL